jgi:hypothetical protein
MAISTVARSGLTTFDKFQRASAGAFAQQFVVSGAGGTVLTSPDGVTWTSRSGLPSQVITAPHRNGNFYCVFDAAQNRWISADGATWSKNGQFAMNTGSGATVSRSWFDPVDRTMNLFSSSQLASGFGYMFDITNSTSIGDRTVVGTTVSSTGYATNGSSFLFSGGVSGSAYLWKSTTSKGGAQSLQAYGSSQVSAGVAFGNNIWVVGCSGGTGLYSSPDTTTWTSRATFAREITFQNGLFLAWASFYLYTSTDGITWTQRTPAGLSSNAIRQIVFGNGVFVLVGAGGYIGTSTDGITWTSRTSGTANELNGVFFG